MKRSLLERSGEGVGSGYPSAVATPLLALALALPWGMALAHGLFAARGYLSLVWMAALLLAASTGLRLRFRGRAPLGAGVAWAAILGSGWGWFWIVDLHRARFAAVLLAVPALGALGALIGRARGALTGAAIALSGVWTLLLIRADGAGCTGVSSAYEATLVLTLLLLYGAGPWALGVGRPGSP